MPCPGSGVQWGPSWCYPSVLWSSSSSSFFFWGSHSVSFADCCVTDIPMLKRNTGIPCDRLGVAIGHISYEVYGPPSIQGRPGLAQLLLWAWRRQGQSRLWAVSHTSRGKVTQVITGPGSSPGPPPGHWLQVPAPMDMTKDWLGPPDCFISACPVQHWECVMSLQYLGHTYTKQSLGVYLK